MIKQRTNPRTNPTVPLIPKFARRAGYHSWLSGATLRNFHQPLLLSGSRPNSEAKFISVKPSVFMFGLLVTEIAYLVLELAGT
jgi:hypothetical protein